MCEANAYVIDKDGNEKLFLPRVSLMKVTEDGMIFESIFSERKSFEGRIKEMALLDHKIILEEFEKN